MQVEILCVWRKDFKRDEKMRNLRYHVDRGLGERADGQDEVEEDGRGSKGSQVMKEKQWVARRLEGEGLGGVA